MVISKKKLLGVVIILCILLAPVSVVAATYWTGTDATNTYGATFAVKPEQIVKVENPGKVYRLSDINNYSAYITTAVGHIGKTIDKAFYWYNNSRLAYVKLFKVTPGQNISFVFSDNQYVYCSEFDESFVMVEDGTWMSTGDVCTLTNKARWIMIVFRQANGDLNSAGGIDTVIKSANIANSTLNYVLFQPFVYTYNLAGGNLNGKTESIQSNRIGVEKVTMPTPTRAGYSFGGWKSDSGKLYQGTLGTTYDANIFKDTTFTAVWNPITVDKVTIDQNYVIVEQNSTSKVKLTATVSPSTALDKTITWSSDDKTVAAVDSSGNVTIGKSGTATITATAASGVTATCTVYVMGFEVKVPAYCSINEAYEITVQVFNNGNDGMAGRKRVLVETEDSVSVYRVGDEDTRYKVVAEASPSYGSGYQPIQKQQYFINTAVSTKLFYRLTPEKNITKAGDYCGNVTFNVTVV